MREGRHIRDTSGCINDKIQLTLAGNLTIEIEEDKKNTRTTNTVNIKATRNT